MSSSAAAPVKRARHAALEARVTTLALPSVGMIRGLLVTQDGSIFVSTKSALFLLSAQNRLSLHAGSRTKVGFKDGRGEEARFHFPTGLVMAADGSLLVTDMFNHRLRRVLPDGMVSTVAGWESHGFADGEGTGARFNSPWGIAVDRHGTVYISDCGNHCIRKVSPCWAVSTLCGSTQRGHADDLGVAAHFDRPRGLVLDAEGNLIVADAGNHCIRKVSVSDGRVTTVAGSRAGGNAAKAHADGRNLAARFNAPCGVAVDGNNAIFVSDWYNHRVRMISAEEGGRATGGGSRNG